MSKALKVASKALYLSVLMDGKNTIIYWSFANFIPNEVYLLSIEIKMGTTRHKSIRYTTTPFHHQPSIGEGKQTRTRRGKKHQQRRRQWNRHSVIQNRNNQRDSYLRIEIRRKTAAAFASASFHIVSCEWCFRNHQQNRTEQDANLTGNRQADWQTGRETDKRHVIEIHPLHCNQHSSTPCWIKEMFLDYCTRGGGGGAEWNNYPRTCTGSLLP